MKQGEYEYLFAYDKEHTDMLHIYVRHLTTPPMAISAFLYGTPFWNAQHQRFESRWNSITLSWVWFKNKPNAIRIISCFCL